MAVGVRKTHTHTQCEESERGREVGGSCVGSHA